MVIKYIFRFDAGHSLEFEVDTERAFQRRFRTVADPPEWTRLEFHQCTNCPLTVEKSPECPVAVDIRRVVENFRTAFSTELLTLEVETPERTYVKQCDTQSALRGLMGLLMATSECTILSRFRGLARTHLPFATMDETTNRVVGAYLAQQVVVARRHGEPDWVMRGLKDYYQQLEELNRSFKNRIDAACEQDAAMNAIGSLIYLAMGVGFSLEEQLVEIQHLTVPPTGVPAAAIP